MGIYKAWGEMDADRRPIKSILTSVGLYLVNAVVMIKIEKGYKLFSFAYFIEHDKRTPT